MITKSDLQSFLQCPRKLWLEHNRPDLIPQNDIAMYRRVADGNIVGEKAREQLGEHILWPSTFGDKATAAETAKDQLAASPHTPAVEVPMVHETLYARADALIPTVGGYVLQETKASSFPLKKDRLTPAARMAQIFERAALYCHRRLLCREFSLSVPLASMPS